MKNYTRIKEMSLQRCLLSLLTLLWMLPGFSAFAQAPDENGASNPVDIQTIQQDAMKTTAQLLVDLGNACLKGELTPEEFQSASIDIMNVMFESGSFTTEQKDGILQEIQQFTEQCRAQTTQTNTNPQAPAAPAVDSQKIQYYQAKIDEINNKFQSSSISIDGWQQEYLKLVAEMEQNQVISAQEIEELRQFVQNTVSRHKGRAKLVDDINKVNRDLRDQRVDFDTWYNNRKTLIENSATKNIISFEEKSELLEALDNDKKELEAAIKKADEERRNHDPAPYYNSDPYNEFALHGFTFTPMLSVGYMMAGTIEDGNITYRGDFLTFGGALMIGYQYIKGIDSYEECSAGWCTVYSQPLRRIPMGVGVYLRQDFLGTYGTDEEEKDKYGMQLLGMSSFILEYRVGAAHSMFGIGAGPGAVYPIHNSGKPKLVEKVAAAGIVHMSYDFRVSKKVLLGFFLDLLMWAPQGDNYGGFTPLFGIYTTFASF